MEKTFVVLCTQGNIPSDIKVAKVGTAEEVEEFLKTFNLQGLFGILPIDSSWELSDFDEHLDEFGLDLGDEGSYILVSEE